MIFLDGVCLVCRRQGISKSFKPSVSKANSLFLQVSFSAISGFCSLRTLMSGQDGKDETSRSITARRPSNTVGRSHGHCTVVPQQKASSPKEPLGRMALMDSTSGQDSGILWPSNVSNKSLQSILQAQHVGLGMSFGMFFGVWTIRCKRGMVGQLYML